MSKFWQILCILGITINVGCSEKIKTTCIGEKECPAYGVFALDTGKSGIYNPTTSRPFYDFLVVRPDGTFIVKTEDDSYNNMKQGTWRYIKTVKDERQDYSIIEFKTSNNEIIFGSVTEQAYLYSFANNFNDGVTPNALYIHVLCDENYEYGKSKTCEDYVK